MTEPKNNLLLKALRQEEVPRPPVWMMRQAGRYLPEYMKLREKYSFFERIETPELAAEITVQPVDIVGVDAAILFSDILVIPQAMGFDVEMVEKKGPVINNPVRSEKVVTELEIPDVDQKLKYVYDAISVTKEMLNNEVPLIGFAGAPWTILCYIVEGQGSKKGFITAKEFCFKHEKAALSLLDKITETTILYLKNKIAAGVNAVQIFDSWGGILSPDDYDTFSLPFIRRIVEAISDETYVISYPKGCWSVLDRFNTLSNHAVGVDWLTTPEKARSILPDVTVQGNLDPMRLLSDIPTIKSMTSSMIDQFGSQSYIANLGHGIIPNIPVDHAKAFVDTVKSYNS